MNSSVSVQEKKLFLEWLLSQFNPGETEWLLEEMIQDERKLQIIHFVDRIEGCPKGISLRIDEASAMQFLFFKGNIKTRDVYTAFHELQLYEDEAYYIQIDFPNKASNFLYQTVMEADESEKVKMENAAEDLLEKMLVDKQLMNLEENINQALDEQDKDAFLYYSTQLNNFKRM